MIIEFFVRNIGSRDYFMSLLWSEGIDPIPSTAVFPIYILLQCSVLLIIVIFKTQLYFLSTLLKMFSIKSDSWSIGDNLQL